LGVDADQRHITVENEVVVASSKQPDLQSTDEQKEISRSRHCFLVGDNEPYLKRTLLE
jgi:hypothetical protein